MDASEQAAEQIVRMTLAGSEVALRLTGAASKNVAAGLLAAAASSEKTKGKTRLATMLKSGKELKVFELKQHDLERFAAEAKRYGVLYTVVKPDEKNKATPLDIMVRAEDASKVNRILEKLGYGRVEGQQVATIEPDKEQEPPEKPDIPQKKDAAHEQSNMDALATILGEPGIKEADKAPAPLGRASMSEAPSEPTSKNSSRSVEATDSKTPNDQTRRSVKRDLEDIRANRHTKANEPPTLKTPERQTAPRPPSTPTPKPKTRSER